jgi:maltooligosyltrehalose trehalohydrolase
MWIRDYHVDGLRLDATHALEDDSPEYFLAQFSREVRSGAGRPVVLIAEDSRNLNKIVKPRDEGGYDFNAVWADDFHHIVRRLTAGDKDGYYADYEGTIAELVKTLNQGWLYEGQPSRFLKHTRGTSPFGLRHENFVFCLQNHDQVGNRAMGERLHHQIDEPTYKAAAALLALVPHRILLFMGQEWGADSPFLFFTDHKEELGHLITEGRRKEFSGFAYFKDPVHREKIPDPQKEDTFKKSCLRFEETLRRPNAALLGYYRALLKLRANIFEQGNVQGRAFALSDDALAVELTGPEKTIVNVVRLKGSGAVYADLLEGSGWRQLLTSEDGLFSTEPHAMDISLPTINFQRPGAAVFERAHPKTI